MNKTGYFAFGLAAVAIGQSSVISSIHGDTITIDVPPLGSVALASGSGTVTAVNAVMWDTTIDVERSVAPVVDTRHPITLIPGVPPSVSVADLGVGYPGGIFGPPKKPV